MPEDVEVHEITPAEALRAVRTSTRVALIASGLVVVVLIAFTLLIGRQGKQVKTLEQTAPVVSAAAPQLERTAQSTAEAATVASVVLADSATTIFPGATAADLDALAGRIEAAIGGTTGAAADTASAVRALGVLLTSQPGPEAVLSPGELDDVLSALDDLEAAVLGLYPTTTTTTEPPPPPPPTTTEPPPTTTTTEPPPTTTEPSTTTTTEDPPVSIPPEP